MLKTYLHSFLTISKKVAQKVAQKISQISQSKLCRQMVQKVSQMATNCQIMPALNFLIIMICPLRGIYDLMTANHAFLQHSKNDIYFFLFKSRPEIYSNIWDLNMRIMLFWIAQLLYILNSTWVLGTPNAGQNLIFPGFSLIFFKFWLTPKHKQCCPR